MGAKKHRSVAYSRQNNVVELILKEDYRVLDRREFNINNPKDKIQLYEYIKEKLGINFGEDSVEGKEFW